MRRNGKMFLALMLVLALTASLFSAAFAETYTQFKGRVLETPRILFQHKKAGLKLGDLPVYTAPTLKGLRMAKGRAKIDTDRELFMAGKTSDGWLLVRYDPGNGTIRTGYIPPQYVRKVKAGKLNYLVDIPVVAAEQIPVTDDPIGGRNFFYTLQQGENFSILGKYTYHGSWWYIECTVDGKTARGFIDRVGSRILPGSSVEDNLNQTPFTLEDLRAPSTSPYGQEKIGDVTIAGSDRSTRKLVYRDADKKSTQTTVVYPTLVYPYYATRTGTNGHMWYYIYVEEDSIWGWIDSEVVR